MEAVEGPDLRRLSPIPFSPESVTDGDWVLITHVHLDHCVPLTLIPIAENSPRCRFVGPPPVLAILRRHGIAESRLQLASETAWFSLGASLRAIAVPAAHPTIVRDHDGGAHCIGYVIEYLGRRVYHAGDTSIVEELLSRLKELAPLEIAFLPVNERNYFRERRGIIGNMTIREAFALAEEIGAKVVVPMHWDMFSPNCVPREEIELAYKLLNPMFEMKIYPAAL